MLPAGQRITTSSHFSAVIRRGARVGRSTLVVHLLLTDDSTSRCGLVVSKAIGGAVARNRAKRQIRHLMARRLCDLPTGAQVVIRALPAIACTESPVIGDELDSALRSALARCQ